MKVENAELLNDTGNWKLETGNGKKQIYVTHRFL